MDILNIKNSLQNLIEKNNTNTSSYNISSSLNEKVQLISGGSSDRVPTLNINYPAIFIELNGVVDTHVELGLSSRRDVECSFQIVAIIDYGIAAEDYEDTDNEMIQLTQNIDELLRNNIRISNTADSCLIIGTEFITDEGTYNARSKTNLIVKKRG